MQLKTANRITSVLEGKCSQQKLCPVKDIVDRFADKWSIYTVLHLGREESLRFNELKNGICGISQRMLAVTLRSLEEDGLVERNQYVEIPPRVEYKLTELGKSLLQHLVALTGWADDHFKEIVLSRKKYARKLA